MPNSSTYINSNELRLRITLTPRFSQLYTHFKPNLPFSPVPPQQLLQVLPHPHLTRYCTSILIYYSSLCAVCWPSPFHTSTIGIRWCVSSLSRIRFSGALSHLSGLRDMFLLPPPTSHHSADVNFELQVIVQLQPDGILCNFRCSFFPTRHAPLRLIPAHPPFPAALNSRSLCVVNTTKVTHSSWSVSVLAIIPHVIARSSHSRLSIFEASQAARETRETRRACRHCNR